MPTLRRWGAIRQDHSQGALHRAGSRHGHPNHRRSRAVLRDTFQTLGCQFSEENASLKAIDFGLSIFFKPGERFNEIVGSPYYMAPEVLKRNYGSEVDVWSAGVILYTLLCGVHHFGQVTSYTLLCGVPPFWAETEQGIAQAIVNSIVEFERDPWPKVSDSAKDLVKRMLDPDPRKHMTATEVLVMRIN